MFSPSVAAGNFRLLRKARAPRAVSLLLTAGRALISRQENRSSKTHRSKCTIRQVLRGIDCGAANDCPTSQSTISGCSLKDRTSPKCCSDSPDDKEVHRKSRIPLLREQAHSAFLSGQNIRPLDSRGHLIYKTTTAGLARRIEVRDTPTQSPRAFIDERTTMDQQAASLLATLKRPAAPSDAKLNALNALKSDIKHFRVPESAQSTIFECIRVAVVQQASSSLAGAAFSTLGHLIKRLKIQDPSGTAVVQLSPRLYGAITDRLADSREPIRASAVAALAELYPFLGQDVERIIREDAISGPNARAKEAGSQWVVQMHKDEGMPFKVYVAPMVACLEDADGGVREAAKNALIELFRDAPDRAKTDLKRQMKAHSVRHSIESQILAQIGATSAPKPQQPPPESEADLASSTRSLPPLDPVAHLADSIHSEAAQPPPQETVQMDPMYVHSERELSDMFREMLPHFEGKETEQNWMPRDKSVLKVRRLLNGNAPTDHHHAFMAGVKSSMEGILKVANSLRTTMSSNGCQLVQELVKTLGPAMDPHVEILLQSFIKMSSATKHIASENGRATAEIVFHNCSYHIRMMQHIWSAAQEKNAQIRQCVPEWLRTVLKRQASYKSHFESSGGLDLAEKCIRKGLDDANPKVKEATRAAYWTMARSWPDKAEAIMNKLDAKSRSLLEKDSNNPNATLFNPQASTGVSAKPAAPAGRLTLKALMAEQRRAKSAARNLPERPNSTMALLSPTKPRPEVGSARAPSRLRTENRVVSHASSTSTTAAASTTSKGSSLMSRPVRRPRRPEIQRPQTADPYASRGLLRPETPASGAAPGSPRRGTGVSNTPIPTPSSSRSRAKTAVGVGSREGSPVVRRIPISSSHNRVASSSRPSSKDSTNGSHTGDFATLREEEMTMTLPSVSRPASSGRRPLSSSGLRPAMDKTVSVDSGLPAMAEDDDLAMVIPVAHSRTNSQTHAQRAQSPLIQRSSPMKAMFDAARDKLDRPSSSASSKVPGLTQADDPFSENGLHSLPPRRGSPVKSIASTGQPEVQIYEDSSHEASAEQPANGERQVLSELPVNENVRVQSPTQSVGSSTSPASSPQHVSDGRLPTPQVAPSAQDRAEVLRNRRLLTSGIERIRARTLDAHGFRRVQDLAKSTADIWEGGKKFDELMGALLDYLGACEQDAKLSQLPAAKSAGLKAQALGVVRALVTVHGKPARPWFDRALVGVLGCRGQADVAGNSNVVADLQRTAEEIIRAGPLQPCVDAVIQYLFPAATSPAAEATAAPSPAPEGSAATAMALANLRALVLSGRSQGVDLGQERKVALARTAARLLEDADAEVRKADVELACEVFGLFGEGGGQQQGEGEGSVHSKAGFWREFRGVDEGRLGLLTYYIARNAQKGQ